MHSQNSYVGAYTIRRRRRTIPLVPIRSQTRETTAVVLMEIRVLDRVLVTLMQQVVLLCQKVPPRPVQTRIVWPRLCPRCSPFPGSRRIPFPHLHNRVGLHNHSVMTPMER